MSWLIASSQCIWFSDPNTSVCRHCDISELCVLGSVVVGDWVSSLHSEGDFIAFQDSIGQQRNRPAQVDGGQCRSHYQIPNCIRYCRDDQSLSKRQFDCNDGEFGLNYKVGCV